MFGAQAVTRPGRVHSVPNVGTEVAAAALLPQVPFVSYSAGGIDSDGPADAERRAPTGCSGSGSSSCGSAPAVDLAASGAGLQSLPSAPSRLRAPGPALSAATEAALHPESWAQPGPHPQGPAREPRGRLAPPTAFAPPGLAGAAEAESPLKESVGSASHQREPGWSPAPRRAFLKDQYPVLETRAPCRAQSRPKAVCRRREAGR